MLNPSPRIDLHRLASDDCFPNHPDLPLLLCRQALDKPTEAVASDVQQLLHSHRWGGTWQNGIFAYHHYHSNAHEVLVVCAGHARVQFGGPHGPIISISAGDVALLPAGTAHKRIDASADFLVVGGYPAGQEEYDVIRDDPAAKAAAERRIIQVPLPPSDPLYGDGGPMLQHWTR